MAEITPHEARWLLECLERLRREARSWLRRRRRFRDPEHEGLQSLAELDPTSVVAEIQQMRAAGLQSRRLAGAEANRRRVVSR